MGSADADEIRNFRAYRLFHIRSPLFAFIASVCLQTQYVLIKTSIFSFQKHKEVFTNVFNAIAGICGTFQELLLNHLQSICRSTIGEACLCIFSSQYHYQTAPIVSFFHFRSTKTCSLMYLMQLQELLPARLREWRLSSYLKATFYNE